MVEARNIAVKEAEQKLKDAQASHHKAVEYADEMRVWREKYAMDNKKDSTLSFQPPPLIGGVR